MKIAEAHHLTKTASDTKSKALVTLTIDPAEEEILSEHTKQFTLRSRPAEADSPSYKVQCRTLQGDETVRQLVLWREQTQKVLHGLHLEEHADCLPIVESMLAGTPSVLFQSAIEAMKQKRMDARIAAATTNIAKNAIRTQGVNHADNVHNDDILLAINHMMERMMPRRVLARVKRFLRRDARKPTDMPVRKYFQNLLRLNWEVLENLPPYGNDQALSNEEIADILLYGTPKSWQKEMERQGFDPMEKTLNQVVGFMERMEATEEHGASSTTVKVAKTAKKKSPSGKPNKGKSEYYCSHHGKNFSHDSAQCFVLHPEKKQKSSSNKNKSWSRKAAENQNKTKSDLNAYVQAEIAKGIKKAVRKELASFEKKRKADSESEDDLCAIELQDFDYDKLKDLSIDDVTLLDDVEDTKEEGEISLDETSC